METPVSATPDNEEAMASELESPASPGNSLFATTTESIKTSLDESLPGDDIRMLTIAVLLKEAVLDSPTFRSSVNHLHHQFENVDRWLDAFVKSTQRMSQEMDGKSVNLAFLQNSQIAANLP